MLFTVVIPKLLFFIHVIILMPYQGLRYDNEIDLPLKLLTAFVPLGILGSTRPLYFCAPQNIITHTLYGILALYSLNPNLNPNQNRTQVPRYLLV